MAVRPLLSVAVGVFGEALSEATELSVNATDADEETREDCVTGRDADALHGTLGLGDTGSDSVRVTPTEKRRDADDVSDAVAVRVSDDDRGSDGDADTNGVRVGAKAVCDAVRDGSPIVTAMPSMYARLRLSTPDAPSLTSDTLTSSVRTPWVSLKPLGLDR